MKRRSAYLTSVAMFIAASLLLFLFQSGSALVQPGSTLVSTSIDHFNGIEVTLQADSVATPGGTVGFTLTVKALVDVPNLDVTWIAPAGTTLLGDPMESFGALTAGESIVSARQVQFPTEGVYQIIANAEYDPAPGAVLGASGVLFFTVSSARSYVSDFDPAISAALAAPVEATVTTTPDALGRDADRVPCFRVSGRLMRYERTPTSHGLEPPTLIPAKFVRVEIREDDDGIGDDSYGVVYTDANGEFSFPQFCDDDGLNNTLELYLRVHAVTILGTEQAAKIQKPNVLGLAEATYVFDTAPVSSKGGDVRMDVTLSEIRSGIINIAEAILDAYQVFNETTGFYLDGPATVLFAYGEGETYSFYNSFYSQIHITGRVAQPDHWDDSVIIHEWGHLIDDLYSCDDSPWDEHSLYGVYDPELAWGEGYPDFWQSAVRYSVGQPDANYYIDTNSNGEFTGIDLETFKLPGGGRIGNEASVAAAMWDLIDRDGPDGDDKVSLPLSMLENTYVGKNFKDVVAYGTFDDDCTVITYLRAWLKDERPHDGDTGAAIGPNLGLSEGILQDLAGMEVERAAETANLLPPGSVRWWDEATMVVDNSSSMAGPPGATKINTVKTIIGEQVNDLTAAPQGTAVNVYTFNAGSSAIQRLIENQFYDETIMPAVNSIAANGADSGCPVPGLGALSQATNGKLDGEAWLYTDGDSSDAIKPETLRRSLNSQRVRASIVLLGGCGSPARAQSDVSGQERTYLGLAADGSQSSGVVPYMLTALLSGGQFIYVAPDQLANAVDMVRAQLSHTAGAGKWSDYVSKNYTYRWDRLESWEYRWASHNLFAQDLGPIGRTSLRVDLDRPVPFFGYKTPSILVSQNGTITLNPCAALPFSQMLDCSKYQGDQYIEPLETNLVWDYKDPGPHRSGDTEDGACGLPDFYYDQVRLYKIDESLPPFYYSDWVTFSVEGVARHGFFDTYCRGLQVAINTSTGEIRFDYGGLRQEAATAEIGLVSLERDPLTIPFHRNEVIVSKNDLNGATTGMGYKFTPAPPQPSRSYEVEVDPFIESVIFMQTGYSGTFASMTVTRPDGSAVGCVDNPHVKCVTVDNKPGDKMVQFIQVDTQGESGTYKAVVSVGSSGNGTFSFNALAASALQATMLDYHTLPLGTAATFPVNIGRTTSNGQLQGWLQTPTGAPFGRPFTLYDDGKHGDREAGDGLFGSDSFTAPSPGAAYLWVKGEIDGVEFQRSDPAPLNFQPLWIVANTPLVDGSYGEWIPLTFAAENEDTFRHCYNINYDFPAGWELRYDSLLTKACIDAGATTSISFSVRRPLSSDTLGEQGQAKMTLTEVEEGAITGVGVADIRLHRSVASIAFKNLPSAPLRPNGKDTAELVLALYDDLGNPISSNKPFTGQITADNGTVELLSNHYEKGYLLLRYTAGTHAGEVHLHATEDGLETTATLSLAPAVPADIAIKASATDLSAANGADLTITVLDSSGEPAAGAKVRVSVNDDKGARGKIDGVVEGVERTTNQSGVVTARFDKVNGASGSAIVQAELLSENGQVITYVTVELFLAPPPTDFRLYLPITQR